MHISHQIRTICTDKQTIKRNHTPDQEKGKTAPDPTPPPFLGTVARSRSSPELMEPLAPFQQHEWLGSRQKALCDRGGGCRAGEGLGATRFPTAWSGLFTVTCRSPLDNTQSGYIRWANRQDDQLADPQNHAHSRFVNIKIMYLQYPDKKSKSHIPNTHA